MAEPQTDTTDLEVPPSPIAEQQRLLAVGKAVGQAMEPTPPSPFGTTGLAGVAEPGSPIFPSLGFETFQERNRHQDGTPFDPNYGVPLGLRIGSMFIRDPTLKVRWLNEQLGNDFARQSDTGEAIVRVLDPETGKAVDTLVDEHSITANDVLDWVGLGPEIIGAMKGMKAAQFLGKKAAASGNKLLQILGSERMVPTAGRLIAGEAVGSEIGGAAKDVLMEVETGILERKLAGLSEFGKIAKERAGMIPADMIAGTVIAGAAPVLRKIITPIGHNRTPISEQFMAGRDWILKEHGVDFKPPLSVVTGSPTIQMTESLLARKPGGAGVMQKYVFQTADNFRRVINKLLGLDERAGTREAILGGIPGIESLPTEQEIGGEFSKRIKGIVDPAMQRVELAKESLYTEATRQIEEDIARSTIPGRAVYPFKIGQALRGETVGKFRDFQDYFQERYRNQLYTLRGGSAQDRILPVEWLPARAQKLIDSLPQQLKTMVNEEGEEVLTQVPFREFINPAPFRRLKALAKNDASQTYSLEDLINMRTNTREAISEHSIRTGKKSAELKNVESLLTDAITYAAGKSPDQNMLPLWKQINEEYAKKVAEFEPDIIDKLLMKKDAGSSYLTDEDIYNRVVTGSLGTKSASQDYLQLKEFLGPDSAAFKGLKRGIADWVFDRSLYPDAKLIDAGALIENLTAITRNNKVLADDVFGNVTQGDMMQLGEFMARIGKRGAPVDAEKVAELLAQPRVPGGLVNGLNKLISEQRALDRLFKSRTFKDIAERKFNPDDYDAGEIVNRLYNMNPDEARQVLGAVSQDPQFLKKIRIKMTERVLFDTQRALGRTDPARLAQGDPFRRPASQALETAFGTEEHKETLRILLGDNGFKSLQALGQIARGTESAEAALAVGAGFAGMSEISTFMRHGPIKSAPVAIKNALFAMLVQNPKLAALVANNRIPREHLPAMTMALLSSQPFLEEITGNWAVKEAEAMASQLGHAIWADVNELLFQQSQPPGPKIQFPVEAVEPKELEAAQQRVGAATNMPQPQAP